MKKVILFIITAALIAISGCGARLLTDDVPASASPDGTGAQASSEPSASPEISEAPETPEASEETEIADDEFVKVADYLPGIYIDLKYATTDNFTGTVLYDFTDAYLRYGTVKKLADVQAELEDEGYSLKIWDAFRPVAMQFKLWEICPDPTYVANPNTGYSSHSRGNTVDVTLVLSDGTDVEMPSGFDDFSALADRDYSDATPVAASNAELLESTMESHGFVGYSGEWWHFSDSDTYPVEENFSPADIG